MSRRYVYLNAPCRVELFKQMFPDLTLPPEPITTRGGTWVEAVHSYVNNYENILNQYKLQRMS